MCGISDSRAVGMAPPRTQAPRRGGWDSDVSSEGEGEEGSGDEGGEGVGERGEEAEEGSAVKLLKTS